MTDEIDARDETAVIKALENPQYHWRTIRGVARDTGLSPQIVLSVLAKNSDVVVKSSVPSKSGEDLYTTRSHFVKHAPMAEKLKGAVENRLF